MYTLILIAILSKPMQIQQYTVDAVTLTTVAKNMEMQIEVSGFQSQEACEKQLKDMPKSISIGAMALQISDASCKLIEGPKT